MIAKEMIGVDVDLPNHPTQSELDNTPIVTGRAAAAGFPAVHPFAALGVFVGKENAATWFEKVLLLGKKFVIRDQRHPTNPSGREVNQTWGRVRIVLAHDLNASRNGRNGRDGIVFKG